MVPLQHCSSRGSIPLVASVDKITSYTLLTIIPYVKELTDLRYVSSNGKVFLYNVSVGDVPDSSSAFAWQ